MRNSLFSIMLLLLVNVSFAQSWEEEIGFLYTKAEYLMETERYEEAIKQLTDVTNKNPEYKQALFLKAKAKYELGAFKGAKKDLMIALDIKGLEADLVQLMGLTEYELGEYDKALKNLNVAEVLSPDNHDIKVALGQIYQNQGKYSLACHKWSEAFKYGSAKARSLMIKHCDAGVGSAKEDPIVMDDNEFFEEDAEPQVEAKVRDRDREALTNPYNKSKSPSSSALDDNDDEYIEEEVENPVSDAIIMDNDINEIIIDEDLTLEIYGNGLGRRRILDQPNILILSDISGKVAVKVCVNKAGRIESAELDEERSSISKQSMISLAIRKSKQFWFAKSKDNEQCGLIVFNIVGS